jgi:hypothetical protein
LMMNAKPVEPMRMFSTASELNASKSTVALRIHFLLDIHYALETMKSGRPATMKCVTYVGFCMHGFSEPLCLRVVCVLEPEGSAYAI